MRLLSHLSLITWKLPATPQGRKTPRIIIPIKTKPHINKNVQLPPVLHTRLQQMWQVCSRPHFFTNLHSFVVAFLRPYQCLKVWSHWKQHPSTRQKKKLRPPQHQHVLCMRIVWFQQAQNVPHKRACTGNVESIASQPDHIGLPQINPDLRVRNTCSGHCVLKHWDPLCVELFLPQHGAIFLQAPHDGFCKQTWAEIAAVVHEVTVLRQVHYDVSIRQHRLHVRIVCIHVPSNLALESEFNKCAQNMHILSWNAFFHAVSYASVCAEYCWI